MIRWKHCKLRAPVAGTVGNIKLQSIVCVCAFGSQFWPVVTERVVVAINNDDNTSEQSWTKFDRVLFASKLTNLKVEIANGGKENRICFTSE